MLFELKLIVKASARGNGVSQMLLSIFTLLSLLLCYRPVWPRNPLEKKPWAKQIRFCTASRASKILNSVRHLFHWQHVAAFIGYLTCYCNLHW